MASVLGRKTNFRVVIEPRRLGDFGRIKTSDTFVYGRGLEAEARIEKEYEERCNEIASEIKRHVDNVGCTSVEFDQERVCEHCGSIWTEASQVYNGGCCSKDEENNPSEQGASHAPSS